MASTSRPSTRNGRPSLLAHTLAPRAALDELRRERDRTQRAPAPLAAGEEAVDEHPERALELLARAGLRQLERLLEPLARRPRAQRRVAAGDEIGRQQAGGT